MRLIDATTLKAEFTGNFKNEYSKGEIHALIDLAPTVGGWISVKDRLPEKGKTVLVARKFVQPGKREKRYVETADWTGLSWSSANDEYRVHPQFHTDPYAWMPLPEPPKEE